MKKILLATVFPCDARMKKYFFLIILVSTMFQANAQNALPDQGFGKDGVAFADFPLERNLNENQGRKIMIAPDGTTYLLITINGQVTITHRNANGSLDMGYGSNGYAEPLVMEGKDAVLQNDGKIVVVGYITNLGLSVFALARYNSNGSLDASFGGDGKLQTTFGLNGTGIAHSVALQTDGKIVVAGQSTAGPGDISITLARYNIDGSLDLGFDGDGKVQTSFMEGGSSGYAVAQSILMQGDGKILVAGNSSTGNGDVFTLVRYHSDGSLDASFDGDGKVQTPFFHDGTYTAASVQSLALQTDGRIVAIGKSEIGIGSAFTLARYNSDGSLDNSFDEDGKVQTPFIYNGTNTYAYAQSGTLQTDNKIVVAGYAQTATGNTITLARFNPDGSLDAGFDGDGIAQPAFTYDGTHSSAYGESVVVQTDGKIVAAGYAQTEGNVPYTLTRYNSDGSLDASFDGDGKLTGYCITGNAQFYATAVQGDGKVVAVGGGFSQVGTGGAFTIARFNSDGSLDASFDGDGKAQTTFTYNGTNKGNAQSVVLQSDGKILAAGYSTSNTGILFTLVRYNSDGSLDAGFDGDGMVQTPIVNDGNNRALAQSVILQTDGKIVVAGASPGNGLESVFTLVRYNSDGSLDASFDGDGKVQTPFLYYNDTYSRAYAQSVIMQNDGKIVAAGYSQTTKGNVFTLARYNSDGSLDASFDGDGKLITEFFGVDNENSQAQSIAIQTDGKIVAAGFSHLGTDQAFAIARYNIDGSLDATFDGDGKLRTTFVFNSNTGPAEAQSVMIQADGRIVLAGSFEAGTGSTISFFRYNTDGSLDDSFFSGGKSLTKIENFIKSQKITFHQNKAYVAGQSRYFGLVGSVASVVLDGAEDIKLTCPENKVVTGNNNECTATVNDIDPILIPINSTTTYHYKLTGATETEGEGTASGKTFNKGITTVTYTLSNDGTKTCSFTVTVEEKKNPLPVIRFTNNGVVREGNAGTRSAYLFVMLSKKSPVPVKVHFKTVANTATQSKDFIAKTGSITFPANSMIQLLKIECKGDNVDENNENFKIVLQWPTNATIGYGTATITIIDDDNPPAIRIDEHVTVSENSMLAKLKVSLDDPSEKSISVYYKTVNRSALAPGDYTAVTYGSISFPPGTTSQFVNITIIKDNLDEPTEKFDVVLCNSVNASISGSRGTGTVHITDCRNAGSTSAKLAGLEAPAEPSHLQVSAYPNPTANQFNVSITSNGEGVIHLKVVDLTGRVIEQRKAEGNSQQLQLGSGWNTGTYFLQVYQGKEFKTIKLIKQ